MTEQNNGGAAFPKCSDTMILGLKQMAYQLKKRSRVMASPNENTGRALLARGLVASDNADNGGWKYYTITDLGYAMLKAREASHDL